jgi:hypothetical protein
MISASVCCHAALHVFLPADPAHLGKLFGGSAELQWA